VVEDSVTMSLTSLEEDKEVLCASISLAKTDRVGISVNRIIETGKHTSKGEEEKGNESESRRRPTFVTAYVRSFKKIVTCGTE
jgi:hypothetical protein